MPADNCAHRETRGGGRVGPPWYWCPVAYGGKQVTPAIHCGPEKCEHYDDGTEGRTGETERTETEPERADDEMATNGPGKRIAWDEGAVHAPVDWPDGMGPGKSFETLRQHCLTLRARGMSWQKIGDAMGLAGNSVQTAVEKLKGTAPAPAPQDDPIPEPATPRLVTIITDPADVAAMNARVEVPVAPPTPDPEPLPQFFEVPPIDITGGKDAADYVEDGFEPGTTEDLGRPLQVDCTDVALLAFVRRIGLHHDAVVFCDGYNAALAATTTERS
jgi:hypothetical protein